MDTDPEFCKRARMPPNAFQNLINGGDISHQISQGFKNLNGGELSKTLSERVKKANAALMRTKLFQNLEQEADDDVDDKLQNLFNKDAFYQGLADAYSKARFQNLEASTAIVASPAQANALLALNNKLENPYQVKGAYLI